MQILKGKKDSHSEINQYVSEKETQVISIDKWASDAKAYKAASDATMFGKTKEDIQKELKESYEYHVNEFCDKYPANFARYNYPVFVKVNDDDTVEWDKKALYFLFSDMSGFGSGHTIQYIQFMRFMKTEMREFVGLTPDLIDQVCLQHASNFNWRLDDYVLELFNQKSEIK
mgnify:CR=1 FL=1